MLNKDYGLIHQSITSMLNQWGERSSSDLLKDLRSYGFDLTAEDLDHQLKFLKSSGSIVVDRKMKSVGRIGSKGLEFWTLTERGEESLLGFVAHDKRAESPNLQDMTAGFFRWTFRDFPKPFVSEAGVSLLFVSAHGDMEANRSLTSDALPRFNDINSPDFVRWGNISDYIHLPALTALFMNDLVSFTHTSSNKKPDIQWKLDLHTDIDTLGNYNIISIGLGNVNSLTRFLLNDFLAKGYRLPIRPDPNSGHLRIISEVGGNLRSYAYRDYVQNHAHPCMLLMLPNIYSDQNHVILLVAGTEIQGTVAGLLALCKRTDINGSTIISNNKFDATIPAKVVQAVVENRTYKSPLRVSSSWPEVVNFAILE